MWRIINVFHLSSFSTYLLLWAIILLKTFHFFFQHQMRKRISLYESRAIDPFSQIKYNVYVFYCLVLLCCWYWIWNSSADLLAMCIIWCIQRVERIKTSFFYFCSFYMQFSRFSFFRFCWVMLYMFTFSLLCQR